MKRLRIAIIILLLAYLPCCTACAAVSGPGMQDCKNQQINPANNNYAGFHIRFPLSLEWKYTDRGRLFFKHFILPSRTRQIYHVGADDSAVYVSGTRNRISKLDIRTGKRIWHTTVPSVQQIIPFDAYLVLRVSDDSFVVLSKYDAHRLDSDPAKQIITRARMVCTAKKSLSTFNLYVTDADGTSYTVDPQEVYDKSRNTFPGFHNFLYKTGASGAEAWKVSVPGTSYIQAMDEQNLYISTFFNAEVLCISKADGRRRWDYSVDRGNQDSGPLQIMRYGKYLMVLGRDFVRPGTNAQPANPDQLDLLFLDKDRGTEKYFQRFPQVQIDSTTGKILYPGNGFFIINNGKGTIFFYECAGK